MPKANLLYKPLFKDPMTIIRICTGIGFIIQGINVFSSGYMDGHIAIFENMHELPVPGFLAYLSKGGEFLAGVLLVLGLFTRPAALFILFNMLVATFYALGGDILGTENYQEQLSWVYAIIAFAIFLDGPSAYSLDEKMSKKNNGVT